MFTINDFINLMKYFKGKSTPELDTNLIIIAEDSKAKAATLFSESIDEDGHNSDDYQRLKNFLIPWYGALRSMPSTMANASDARSLPEDHLNNLISSFGFVDSLSEITHTNKIDFFYDLVNLYKIKGTPEAIEKVLGYFGISDVEVVEYWLKYNSNRELIFHPELVSQPTIGVDIIESADIDFDYVTENDPHWMLSKNQVNQLFLNNRIAFPSKSPYFAIRPTTPLTGGSLIPTISIVSRLIQDYYSSYISGIIIPKNIKIQVLNVYASIFDLYLATIYSYNLVHNKTNDSSSLSFLCYNGDMSLTNDDIFDFYTSMITRENSSTRSELEANKNDYFNYFTKLRSTNFINQFTSAGDVLNTSNKDLKDIIDSYYSFNKGDYVFKLLLRNLTEWIKNNILYTTPELLSLMYGFSSYEYITNVINFFKPYRSRLILVEHIYKIDNPCLDAVLVDDMVLTEINQNVIDFDTGDSTGNIIPDPDETPPYVSTGNPVYYSRNTFDNGSNFDIGASLDDEDVSTDIIQSEDEYANYNHFDSTAMIDFQFINTIGEEGYYTQAGGFTNFDEGGIIDAPEFSDVCEIYIYNV